MTQRHTPDEAGSRWDDLWAVTDLTAVVAATVATLWLASTFGRLGGPTYLRVPLGFLFVFFLPGYAVTSALFPGSSLQMRGDGTASRLVTIGEIERLALSLGLSIFLVSLVGLVMTLLSWQLTLHLVLGVNAAVTLTVTALAAVRRLRRPAHRRWHPQVSTWMRSSLEFVRTDRLNLLLVVFVVIAVGGVGAAVSTPENQNRFTEFALLAPGEDGDPVAADYPTEFEPGEQRTQYVSIRNHEGRTVEYTVVALLQDTTGAVDSRSVSREYRLTRFDARLRPGERGIYEHQMRPPITGEDMMLTYLLYRGQIPDDPTRANAYQSIHLEIDVTNGSE